MFQVTRRTRARLTKKDRYVASDLSPPKVARGQRPNACAAYVESFLVLQSPEAQILLALELLQYPLNASPWHCHCRKMQLCRWYWCTALEDGAGGCVYSIL
jgi:hypothetical protein